MKKKIILASLTFLFSTAQVLAYDITIENHTLSTRDITIDNDLGITTYNSNHCDPAPSSSDHNCHLIVEPLKSKQIILTKDIRSTDSWTLTVQLENGSLCYIHFNRGRQSGDSVNYDVAMSGIPSTACIHRVYIKQEPSYSNADVSFFNAQISNNKYDGHPYVVIAQPLK